MIASIHYRRRYFYLLWVVLLLASLGGLVLWETPGKVRQGRVEVRVLVKGLPDGVRASVWAGPKGRWFAKKAPAANLPASVAGSGLVSVSSIPLQAAWRRWTRSYIPRRTDDWVVLRLEPATGPVRYLAFSLESDWLNGMLGEHRILRIDCECRWQNLKEAPESLSGLI